VDDGNEPNAAAGVGTGKDLRLRLMTTLLRSARTVLAAALLVSPLVACDSITGTDNLARAQDELDRNWDRFQSTAPLSYSYTVHVTCDCPTDVTRPVNVYVDRGSVEYLYYQDDGRAVPYSISNSFPSVEQLFDAIQDGIDRRADRIDVDYDPTYGYPTNVFIDYDRNIADEELLLNTWGLKSWN
jgi:hypothetical protein